MTASFSPERRSILRSAAGLCLAAVSTEILAAAQADCRDYVDAFYFGFPIFEFARTAQRQYAATSARGDAPSSSFTHRAQLADHTARNVTTPNNDTIYSSARLDLVKGPALIEIPTVTDRYFSVAFMNALTDNFAYVGTRATGGAGGRFLVVGPRWDGSRIDGVRIIRSCSDDVWALARIGVAGEHDLASAERIQRQLKIVSAAPLSPLKMQATQSGDASNFTAVVSAMLERIDGGGVSQARRRRLRAVGLGGPTGLTKNQIDMWRAVVPMAMHTLSNGFDSAGEVINGWRYPSSDIGDAAASDFIRAATALSGLAALSRKEAVYVASHTDASGEPLAGSRTYGLFLPRDIPTDAFWSLSIYRVEPDGRLFFFDNPIRRYSIGSTTPLLRRRSDGGVAIRISPTDAAPPTDQSNWLPSMDGNIRLIFRLYLPRKPARTGAWRLPALVREPV